MRNKNDLIALLLLAMMMTGCGFGEADYTYAEVQSIYAPVVDEIIFITPETKVLQQNLNEVTTVRTTTDREITYSIIGGEDAALFVIDAVTGKLSFVDKPAYIEDGDNSYEVTIEARLEDGRTSVLPLTVTVVEDLTASEPIIEGLVNEIDAVGSEGVIMQIKARPADESTTLTYALAGRDAAKFQIDANGNLSFSRPFPVYDGGSGQRYEVGVTVTDGYGNSISTGTISIRLVENPDLVRPVIVSERLSIPENTLGAAQIEVSAAGTGTVVQYLISGPDAALFNVTSSGILYLAEAKDYETPPQSFNIDLQVVDDKGNISETRAVTVSIIDIDEGFTFAPISGFTPVEGEKDVGTVTATPKIAGTAHYSLVQCGETFTIDNEGHLQFIMTAQKDRRYSVQVQVENQYNGSQTLSAIFSVTVVNDDSKIAPVIGTGYSVQNSVTSPIGTADVITTISASAEGNATALFYTTGGPDGDRFSIDAGGNLTFKEAYDFYSPADYDADNIYEVIVEVRDDNGNLSSTQLISVELLEDPDKIIPVILSSTYNVDENTVGTMPIQTLAEGSGVVDTYKIVGGADAARLEVYNGILRFKSAPDFELPLSNAGDNRYRVQLEVEDSLGNISAVKEIIVNVLDVDERLMFTSLQNFTHLEGSAEVGIITATPKQSMSAEIRYTIGSGSADFTIGENDGTLSFISVPAYQAEGNNVHTLTVVAESQYNGSRTMSGTITVTVMPLSFAITFESNQTTAYCDQNTVISFPMTATSAAGKVLSYALEEGYDPAIFGIDASNGYLTITAPTYNYSSETNANTYYAAVVASDDEGHSARRQGTLYVNAVNGLPYFSSAAAVSVDENIKALPVLSAVSPIGSPLRYTIDGGADSSLFTLTSEGALSFTYAQNYENPQDQNRDNVYEVIVRVTDTLHALNTAVQTLYITVNDVDDAASNMVFSRTGTTSLSVNDGTYVLIFPSNTVTYEYVTATPSPSDGALSYRMTANPDSEIFSMTSNGQLKIDAPPFSSDQNYEIGIEVSETYGETSTQILNVTILD